MKKAKKIELLSPAGSFDALKQAVHNGADAVYLGGTLFGARAYANNFDNNQLLSAIEYAHLYGVKIYVTVNTLIYETEVSIFKEYIRFLVSANVDALIVQDIGVANWIINSFDIPVHSSTQMHNHSLSNIKYLKKCGFDRAVLARETEISAIKKMSKIIDTEVFVHGALCISYSGQCLFSAIEHDRSGNRGKCAQACRMKYSLYVDNNLIIKEKYLLSPKDLALLEDTAEVIKANTTSLKLEGRMKSPEYVGFVTKTYRKIIDNFYQGKQNALNPLRSDTLRRLFNRGFSKGYTFGLDNKSLMTIDRPNHAGVCIGDVIETNKDFITIKLSLPLHQGDGIKFEREDKGFICNKIYRKGKLTAKGDAGEIIRLENKSNIKSKDRLLLTKDITLLKSLENYTEKKISVKIKGEFVIGENCKITISDDKGNIAIDEGVLVEQSKNAPLSEENIINSLSKLGGSSYVAEKVIIQKDNNIFISKGNINKLRRDAVEVLNSHRLYKSNHIEKPFKINYIAPKQSPLAICCKVNNEEQLIEVLRHKIDKIYVENFDLYNEYKKINNNIYFCLPNLNENTDDYSNEHLVIRDTGGIAYAQNNYVISDYMLNVANSLSIAHLHMNNIKSVCLSVELSNEIINTIITNYNKQYNNLPNIEIVIYGRIQLMMLKHCVLEGNIECDKCKNSNIVLKDIKGESFPLKTDSNCRNYIFAKEPFDKIQSIQYFKSIGVNGFRLDFLDESAKEIKLILSRIII